MRRYAHHACIVILGSYEYRLRGCVAAVIHGIIVVVDKIDSPNVVPIEVGMRVIDTGVNASCFERMRARGT